MKNNIIREHLEKYDLDVRKSGNARFMDQKVTPDNLSFISECILNLPIENQEDFIIKDIWDSSYFLNNVPLIYNKPSPKNDKAKSEYDKFIHQPLKCLGYSRVLNESKIKNKNHFSVNSREILEYISMRERHAFIFLLEYLNKVLKDSGILRYFENFKKKNDLESFNLLKKKFIEFIVGNTKIKGKFESPRIFPKILNVYSAGNHIKGTKQGTLTTDTLSFTDLSYNAPNFRDKKKGKSYTRKEADLLIIRETPKRRYFIEIAKRKIKQKYSGESELKDKYNNDKGIDVHHIFPSSKYSGISDYLENLILLTKSQHGRAHPDGKTGQIRKDYQYSCLLAKLDSVQKSISNGELFYSLPNFIHVLNIGLGLEIKSTSSIKEIQKEIDNKFK